MPSNRLGPIDNTHLFFDEDGNESHRCRLVFETEQEMIAFNCPDNEEDDGFSAGYEDPFGDDEGSEGDEEGYNFRSSDEYEVEREPEDEQEDDEDEETSEWNGITLPPIRYRFLIPHPLALLKFFNFVDEYNQQPEASEKQFTIPPIPSHIVDHILNHYQHRNPKHPHRQFLHYSADDEAKLCRRVKDLDEASPYFEASEETWDIKDEGRDLDDWNRVYMPYLDFRFTAFHPRVLVAFFHFISTYNVFHHPNNAYRFTPIPASIIESIEAHPDIQNENKDQFRQQNDINFLLGSLDYYSEDKQYGEYDYDDYEQTCPEQAAFDKEFFGY